MIIYYIYIVPEKPIYLRCPIYYIYIQSKRNNSQALYIYSDHKLLKIKYKNILLYQNILLHYTYRVYVFYM